MLKILNILVNIKIKIGNDRIEKVSINLSFDLYIGSIPTIKYNAASIITANKYQPDPWSPRSIKLYNKALNRLIKLIHTNAVITIITFFIFMLFKNDFIIFAS